MATLEPQREAAALFKRLAADRLTWLPDLGVGYLPIEEPLKPYDVHYFAKYLSYRNTALGHLLTNTRVEMVQRYWGGPLVDVGIGCGAFVEARAGTRGYDVNPTGIQWLRERDLYCDPYTERVQAISLWDVIEHIADFDRLLARVASRVFVSTPVHRDAHHVLISKHHRPDEHCWYWTASGFIGVMRFLGWELLEHNEDESLLGREDIGSFVFHRPD